MITTILCREDGCDSNCFYIRDNEEKLQLTCIKCNKTWEISRSKQIFTILSNCSSCSNETFKVFKDTEGENIFFKCIKCGNPPEKVYIDDDGVQVSYEVKILNDMKYNLYRLNENLKNLEEKINGLESGQDILEQSLAYVTKFLSN